MCTHNIFTPLYYMYLGVIWLKTAHDFALQKPYAIIYNFIQHYLLASIILNLAQFQLFQPVWIELLSQDNRWFLHLKFSN